MGASEKQIERECHALGVTVDFGQSLPPQVYMIGHGRLPTQNLKDLFELVEYLVNLAEGSDFFDSAPETWWGKLSEQSKQNARELFSIIWEGYNRSKKAVEQPIISARSLEISPAVLMNGWYTDAEAKRALAFASVAIAGLFEPTGLTTSGIIERLQRAMQSFVDFTTHLQDQLEADFESLQAFADFLAGRSATYADALVRWHFAPKPIDIVDRAFEETLKRSATRVLTSPSLDPPYPKGVLRFHALAHQFEERSQQAKKAVDAQLNEFMRQVFLEETSSPYYRELSPQIESVIAHNPRKALLLDLLLEARETSKPITQIARQLPGEFEPTELSKQASRLRHELESIYQAEDPLLTFLRKIGR